MNLCVRNMINLVGLSIQDAIKMATLNPAKVIGVDEKKGSLVEGKNADLVVFDKNINILTTAVKGKVVFSRKSVITPLEEDLFPPIQDKHVPKVTSGKTCLEISL